MKRLVVSWVFWGVGGCFADAKIEATTSGGSSGPTSSDTAVTSSGGGSAEATTGSSDASSSVSDSGTSATGTAGDASSSEGGESTTGAGTSTGDVCACEGEDVGETTCADLGFSCGSLACDGCNFDTSGCLDLTQPAIPAVLGPDFSENGECWLPCAGYIDLPDQEDIPYDWGIECDGEEFDRLRIVCGTPNAWRYIDVDKNIFREGLDAYPEVGLIADARDQDGELWVYDANAIYATDLHPHNGSSWWGGGNLCSGQLANELVVNQGACGFEAELCFGQGFDTTGHPNEDEERYLWVYVAP